MHQTESTQSKNNNGELNMNDKILLRGTVASELRECPGRFKEDYLQVELKCSRRGGNSKDVNEFV